MSDADGNQLPEHADLVVVGSGSSGQHVALRAARAGLRVVLVEKRKLGGTCPLRGCDPKKALWEIVHAYHQARCLAADGILGGEDLSLHWDRVIDRKRELVGGVSQGTAEKMRAHGVAVAIGEARFSAPDALTVGGQQALRFERVVLATGAHPKTLDLPGADLALTSDDFLDRDWLPTRMVCIGGGYIGMELGCMAAAAGCAVQVVMPGERPLPGFDPGCVDALVEHWRERGLEIVTQRRVVAIEPDDDGAAAVLDDDTRLAADQVLNAAGRVPATADLDLAQAGIATEADGRVTIDADGRCAGHPAAWAIGDCASMRELRLTPVANRQARWVADQITGTGGAAPRLDLVPSVAFTLPPVAALGAPLAAFAPEQSLERELTGKAAYRRLRQPGRLALVRDDAGALAGVHLLGPHAEEVINLAALALRADDGVAALGELVAAYPTFAADLPGAVRGLLAP